jgi:hypothetical protein
MPRNVHDFTVKNVVGFYDPDDGDITKPGNFLERILLERAILLLEMGDSPLRRTPDSPIYPSVLVTDSPIDPSVPVTGPMLSDILRRSGRFPTYPEGLLHAPEYPLTDTLEAMRAAERLAKIVPSLAPSTMKVNEHMEFQNDIWNLRARRVTEERAMIREHPDIRSERWRVAWGGYLDVMQRDATLLKDLGAGYSEVTAWVAIGEQTGKYLGHIYSYVESQRRELNFIGIRKAPSVFLGITPQPRFSFANRLLDEIMEKVGTMTLVDPLPVMAAILKARDDAIRTAKGWEVGGSGGSSGKVTVL